MRQKVVITFFVCIQWLPYVPHRLQTETLLRKQAALRSATVHVKRKMMRKILASHQWLLEL